jgi:hypothetical protein
VAILEIPVASLGLSFADVDADGAMELVIATQSELQVYEGGSIVPLVSPRGLDSDSIDAMVGGPFDAMAGDDVVILFADELRLHGSDGMGNFGVPTTSATSWPDSLGLLAGEFDGPAPADLLIWGTSGAGVRLGSGDEFSLGDGETEAATARSLDDPVGGFMLQRGQLLEFYTVVGGTIASSPARADPPFAVTSIEHLGDGYDLSSSVIEQEWTFIEERGPATGNLGNQWGLVGQVMAMAGGDFDGDARADVALIVGSSVQIRFDEHDPDSCLAQYPYASIATGLAVGDHDGDGDDELAVRFDGGHVSLLDGE